MTDLAVSGMWCVPSPHDRRGRCNARERWVKDRSKRAVPHDDIRRRYDGTMETKAFLEGVQAVEAARETMRRPSFMSGLFAGEPDFRLLVPPTDAGPRDAEFES